MNNLTFGGYKQPGLVSKLFMGTQDVKALAEMTPALRKKAPKGATMSVSKVIIPVYQGNVASRAVYEPEAHYRVVIKPNLMQRILGKASTVDVKISAESENLQELKSSLDYVSSRAVREYRESKVELGRAKAERKQPLLDLKNA